MATGDAVSIGPIFADGFENDSTSMESKTVP